MAIFEPHTRYPWACETLGVPSELQEECIKFLTKIIFRDYHLCRHPPKVFNDKALTGSFRRNLLVGNDFLGNVRSAKLLPTNDFIAKSDIVMHCWQKSICAQRACCHIVRPMVAFDHSASVLPAAAGAWCSASARHVFCVLCMYLALSQALATLFSNCPVTFCQHAT